jgi:hypothetical protein
MRRFMFSSRQQSDITNKLMLPNSKVRKLAFRHHDWLGWWANPEWGIFSPHPAFKHVPMTWCWDEI